MNKVEIRAAFTKILHKLDVIDAKVSVMPTVSVQVSSRFLPPLNALTKLGRPASAGEVAAVTGRSRAFESANLNALACQGVLLKFKQGRKCLFEARVNGGQKA